MRLYGDLRRPTATAFAERSLIVAIRSFCNRSTNRTVAVQSQYTRATPDRVQTEYSSSATMDDRTATTLRAVRTQTDSWSSALRSKSRRKEFWTAKYSLATYNDRMATSATDHDHAATVLRPYCDLPRFDSKTGLSTVAASVWLGYYCIWLKILNALHYQAILLTKIPIVKNSLSKLFVAAELTPKFCWSWALLPNLKKNARNCKADELQFLQLVLFKIPNLTYVKY